MNSVQSGGTSIKKKDSQYEEGPIFAEESRNWRGIFISILVIASVLGMILFSIFILTPVEENSMAGRKLITLSELRNRKFEQHNYKFMWINDKAFVMMDRDKKLLMFDVEEMSKSAHVDNTTFRQLDVQDYMLSSDLKYVLLYSKSTNERGTQYFIYEMESSNISPLTVNKTTASLLQKVVWAPSTNETDAGRSQAIAFVHKYDIFYKPRVEEDVVYRITTTGKKDLVLNGLPDWLYSNIDELKSESMVFSGDGQYLAFMSFNLSQVREYNYTRYDAKTLYPRIESMRYPKAFTPNPEVSVTVATLNDPKNVVLQKMKLPKHIPTDCYMAGVKWTRNGELSITLTYRNQTKMLVFLCRPPQFSCVQVYTEAPLKARWLSPAENLFYSSTKIRLEATPQNGNGTTTTANATHTTPTSNVVESSLNGFSKFLLKTKYLANTENRKLHFRHVVLVSIADQKVFPVTSGHMEVLKILAWDEEKRRIYFMATGTEKPGERHLYRKFLDAEALVAAYGKWPLPRSLDDLECLTCSTELKLFTNQADNMTIYHYYNAHNHPQPTQAPNKKDDHDHSIYNSSINCLYNDITLSSKYSYYILECLGPHVPSIYLIDSETNEKVATIDDGIMFHQHMLEYVRPEIEQFAVQTKNGFHTQVKVYLPPEMKKNLAATFPLVLHVDSGPQSQLVNRKFSVDFNWYLATVKSYIVVQIDGRGSGFNGDILSDETEKYLGAIGVEDQLAVLSYLRDTFDFIDSSHICIYGWGFGGYAVTQLLIEDYRKIILCGIAINPIVNFKFYNSFFTERYFTSNAKESTALDDDLASKAQELQGRNYFLIQGTGDEVVHEQHAFSLVKSLVEKEVIFRQQVYKDEGHHMLGIFLHLYKTIESFYDEHFIKTKKISNLITSKEWRRLKKID